MAYQPALDGLRAISVLLVLALHASYGHFPGGWLGVNVFFVLSGFLITSILLDEHVRSGGLDKKRFYYRCALRLLPALIGTLALTAALWWQCEWPESFWYSAAASLFYYANWVKAFDLQSLGAFGHMWSLSVEEQFYLIWPFALPALLGRCASPLSRAKVLCAAALFLTCARSLLWFEGSPLADYNSTLARADALVLGAALAAALRDAELAALDDRQRRGLGRGGGAIALDATSDLDRQAILRHLPLSLRDLSGA